ncbi:hypothetical protein LPUS_12549 [Lasallia pustulata]|uniref:Uncharacterized protein n=1 Tax=Lasallia pustulata TaxID=136370 RepID=A0A1W5DES0_9LECA|nr:hypothetical protein LPUS_12549 [Lasallia pustulata]
MPSHLRYSTSSSTPEPSAPREHPTSSVPPRKKQKMSLTQTYYLAHTARGKLSHEASQADHDLRLLVGHANLLDTLMLDLAEAEREQESWFDQTVKSATEEPKQVQWAQKRSEDVAVEEWDEDSSDSDSDGYEEIEDMRRSAPRRLRSPPPPTTITTTEVDADSDEEEDDEDGDGYLALTRTSSQHTPELLHELDSDSEDDSAPSSPEEIEIPLDAFSEKQRQAIATTTFYQHTAVQDVSGKSDFFDQGFYLPPRHQQPATVSAY